MPTKQLDVLYEDNHLLVLSKPAGMATMGIADQNASLLGRAKEYIRIKYDKPGNVYLGVVSRLDSLVSGVIVFARTSKAAARLNEQFKQGTVEKSYLAAVEGQIKTQRGTLVDWLIKNESQHKMQVTQSENSPAKKAILDFEKISDGPKHTVLRIGLETGRKHQIRVQLSAISHPIIGDRKYGSSRAFATGIALHSQTLSLLHPTTKEPLTFTSPPPEAWKPFRCT